MIKHDTIFRRKIRKVFLLIISLFENKYQKTNQFSTKGGRRYKGIFVGGRGRRLGKETRRVVGGMGRGGARGREEKVGGQEWGRSGSRGKPGDR